MKLTTHLGQLEMIPSGTGADCDLGLISQFVSYLLFTQAIVWLLWVQQETAGCSKPQFEFFFPYV